MPKAKPATARPARRSATPAPPRNAAAKTPETDLVLLAGQIPAEILQQLAAAVKTGHWLFAVWSVSAGTIHLERTATSFPTVDLSKAAEMLSENLKELTQPAPPA